MGEGDEDLAGVTYRVLSLFAGIGGFDLGLERAGFRTAAFCEIDPYARRVLAKHWPEVPCYHDVRELTAERLAADGIAVDLICGGFPCQPFSSASRGRRVATDFWPEMRRIVAEVRPRYVLAENVQRAPIERARIDLRELGYAGSVHHLTAARAGADHQRSRWWLCAYADDESELPVRVHDEVARVQTLCAGLWGAENYARAIRVPDGISIELDTVGRIENAESNNSQTISEAQIAIGRILRYVWEHRETAKTSPELYRNGLRDRLPALPCRDTQGGWLLGPRITKDQGLCDLWAAFYAEPFQKAQVLQRGLLERARAFERLEKVAAYSRKDRLERLGNAVLPIWPELFGRAILASDRIAA